MAEQRHARRIGHSVVVAIPTRVREHLGLEAGQPVYFHLARGGEVVLAMVPVRAGGRPEGLALKRQLDEQLARNAILRQRVHTRDMSTLHEGMNAGFTMAMKQTGAIDEKLASIEAGLGEIYRILAPLAAEPPPDSPVPPASAPPPSPVLSEGEAGTAGPSVPGGP